MKIPTVQLKDVSKVIKGKSIVNQVNLEVHEGEIVGFLGPNGAGKTTTIRMMVGLTKMTRGDIIICGKSISDDRKGAIVNIGAIVENPELYKFMTGYQNLKYFARLSPGVSNKDLDEIIELVGLRNRIHDKVKTYSLGMRQRLGLAQCLIHKPKVLILDEPTNGLDPLGIKEIRQFLRKLANEKKLSVIVSSHLLSEMELMCDRIAIIKNGRIINTQSVGTRKENEQQIIIEVNHPEKAKQDLLKVYGDLTITCSNHSITVVAAKDRIPQLTKILYERNHDIYGVKDVTKSLEDRFLEMTEEGGKSMLALIQNELIKLIKRPGTVVMIGLLLLMVIGAGAMMKYNVSKSVYTENWKEQLQSENVQLSEDLENLSEGTIAFDNYNEMIAVNQYRIEHDLKPNSSIDNWTFVKEARPLIAFAGLFTIIIAASIVSSEFSWGTIKLIMIRTSTRYQILLAKYVTVIFTGLIFISILFISSLILGSILFGITGENIQLTYTAGKVVEENMAIYLIQYYLLSSIDLLLIATMAFMISTVFRNNAFALGISLFAYFTGTMITQMMAIKFDWAKYILFANTDLNMYTTGNVLIEGMTPTFSIIVLSLYLLIFLFTSFISFAKRDIAT